MDVTWEGIAFRAFPPSKCTTRKDKSLLIKLQSKVDQILIAFALPSCIFKPECPPQNPVKLNSTKFQSSFFCNTLFFA